MKPCAFAGQTLLSHSLGSLNEARGVFDEAYFKVVKRRMDFMASKLQGDLDREFLLGLRWEDWRELTHFLVAFHDVGKAAEYYQEQFHDWCEPRKGRSSFFLHEIGSAVFLYKNQWRNEVVKMLAVLAVLNHLNAMRGLHVPQLVESVKQGMLRLRKYAEGLLKELPKFNLDAFLEGDLTLADYQLGDAKDMMSWLSKLSNQRGIVKGYTLLLLPVIVGDNLDSSEGRELDHDFHRKRRFFDSLRVLRCEG